MISIAEPGNHRKIEFSEDQKRVEVSINRSAGGLNGDGYAGTYKNRRRLVCCGNGALVGILSTYEHVSRCSPTECKHRLLL